MKPYRRESDLRDLVQLEQIEKGWKSLLPYLQEAAFRLNVYLPSTPRVLKNYSDEFLEQIFGPPASILEERIQRLAGMILALLFPEKEIDFIITKALPEASVCHPRCSV